MTYNFISVRIMPAKEDHPYMVTVVDGDLLITSPDP